jgi:hypothetical protein
VWTARGRRPYFVVMNDLPAPGWDAIDATLRRLYPAEEPRHIGYTPGLAFGSGLQGCSAYRAADHWHYVTYGLTELWVKEPESDPQVSGWGYELTIRVTGPNGESAPNWPFDLLEKIARYTHENSHPFAVGDRLDPGAPITGLRTPDWGPQPRGAIDWIGHTGWPPWAWS